MDSVGRPVDATIRFFRGGVEVGYVASTAGRFSLFDLDHGEYEVRAHSSRGTDSPPRSLTLPPAGISRPVIRVP
jgi:hypothetical protein